MIRRTWVEMGMPVTVCIVDDEASDHDINEVADLLARTNQQFSPYLASSEISRFNAGLIARADVSLELDDVLQRCDQTTTQTDGFFDAMRFGRLDPSGLVKGLAIQQSSDLLRERGFADFVVEAGGDLQTSGHNPNGDPWRVGIRNPACHADIVKVLGLSDLGIATSGTAIRGSHIYDPQQIEALATDVASLTVIAPSIYDADRYATAAFAMGRDGLSFLVEELGLDAYAIYRDGTAEYSSEFERYVR